MIPIILSFLFSSHAGFFIGGFAGKSSDNGSGIEKLEGKIVGGKIGWRWRALELARTSYDKKTQRGQSQDYFVEKADVDGSATDFIFRFYPFSFLSLAAGNSSLDIDGDIHLTNIEGNPGRSLKSTGSLYDNGSLFAAGLHLPQGGFQLFGEYMIRRWSSLTPKNGMQEETPDLVINQWQVGLMWEWDQINARSGNNTFHPGVFT